MGDSSRSHDCFLSHKLWESLVSAFTHSRTLSLNTELIWHFLLQKGFSQTHGMTHPDAGERPSRASGPSEP